MLAAQRHNAIVRRLEEEGAVRVVSLAAMLSVSEMTVRRDLDALDADGVLRKVHGGAVSVHNRGEEPWASVKARKQRAEKTAIAKAALSGIADGMTIALSAGTTTLELARLLSDRENLTVLTNSLSVFAEITDAQDNSSNSGPDVYLTGGSRTRSDALVGPIADRAVEVFRVDATYLGVHGLDPIAGLTTPNIAEAVTNQRMIDIGDRLVVLADHSKYTEVGTSVFARLSDVDTLITDDGLDHDAQVELSRLVGELVVVNTEVTR